MASQGPLSPASSSVVGGGTYSWSNTGNVLASDDADAFVNLGTNGSPVGDSDYLAVTDFGFSIPSTDIITGVLVEVEWGGSGSGLSVSGRFSGVYLRHSGSQIGNENTTQTQVTGTDTYYSRGGVSDLFGASLTPAIVNSSTFGAAIKASRINTTGSLSMNVDHIRLTVYHESSNTAPTITAGPTVDYATGAALTPANSPADVDFTVTDAEETGAGEISWEIRTATGGGGTLVTSGTATSGIGETAEIAWNDPGIVEGTQTLYLLVSDGTDTDEESFSLTVDLEQTISAAHLASSLQLHNATLTAGEATVSAAHLDSGLQLHNATLTTGAATLDAAALGSTLSLETATITTTVTLDAAHLDSTLQLHNGEVYADGSITALHLDSTLTLYNATVIFDQRIEAAHLDNSVTLYNGLVSNDEGIAAEHLASTLELHLATLTPGAAEIAAALLDNEVALYGAGVLPGVVTLDAAHLALTGQLHDAQVVPGAATVDALHLASLLQMYPATMGFDQTLAAALLDVSVVLYPGTFLRPVPSRARLRDRTTYYRLADRTDEYRLRDRTTRYRLRKE